MTTKDILKFRFETISRKTPNARRESVSSRRQEKMTHMNGEQKNEEVYDMKQAVSANKLIGLWRLTQQFRPIYFAAIAAVALAALSQTSIYYLLRYLVDTVLQQQNAVSYLPWFALAFIGLAVCQGGFTYFSGRWAAYTAENIARRVRDYLYDHLQRLPFTYHDQTQTGELIQRVTSDIDAVRLFFAEQAIGIGRISFLFIVNFIGIYLLDSYLAWMSVILIPIIVGASIYFFIHVGVVYELFQEQEAVLSNRFQENISGVRVVKAFARQAHEIERFEIENAKKKKIGIRFTSLHWTFWPVTDILCGAQMMLGLWIGATMAIRGEISLGTYLAYAQMVNLIIWPIRNMGRLITQASTAAISYTRLRDIVEQVREPLAEGVHRPQGDVQGAVRFENVSFAYETALKNEAVRTANTVGYMAREQGADLHKQMLKLPVLHEIDFAVEAGQTVALLGSTGSGKTSLVNLMPRFYDFDEGAITVDGVDVRRYPREYLRQQIGLVMQEPFLFSRSIRDNITYGVNRVVTEEEIFEAARAAAVHDVILAFPEGYETKVGERGVTLSGGQKQRVTLARTLLKAPSILVLDDATSAVDNETESQIRSALARMLGKSTTFIIAHRVQSVMLADLILVMDDGRIVQRGTHRELVSQPGIYQRVYNLQAQIEDELAEELSVINE